MLKSMFRWISDKAIPVAVVGLFLVVIIVTFVGESLSAPRPYLENGAIVHITESRTFEIFLEDSRLPRLESHEFVFVNTQSGERVVSRIPINPVSYGISGLFGDFHGRLVALVDLYPGSYVVEFEPWDGPGNFIWGG